MPKPIANEAEIVITEIQQGVAEFYIVGLTPLVYNSMNFHAQAGILFPKGKKTAAQKATTLKHVPLQEYRDSVYRRRDDETGPTRLVLPSIMFKAATADVAKRIPGSSKSEIQQLVWVNGANVDLYGIPQVYMRPVRSADIKRTPDIRTRAIVPNWCCKVSVTYVQPHLQADTVGKLLAAAGVLNGVGDYRQQKGAGNYGQFQLVNKDDAEFARIVESGGMAAQDFALQNPVPFDHGTEQLWNWFNEQMKTRDAAPQKGGAARKRSGEEEAGITLAV